MDNNELMKIYEELMKEQQKVLSQMKSDDDKKLQRKVTILTALAVNILKLHGLNKD